MKPIVMGALGGLVVGLVVWAFFKFAGPYIGAFLSWVQSLEYALTIIWLLLCMIMGTVVVVVFKICND